MNFSIALSLHLVVYNLYHYFYLYLLALNIEEVVSLFFIIHRNFDFYLLHFLHELFGTHSSYQLACIVR